VIEPATEAHLDAWRAFARPVVVGAVRLQPAWLPHEQAPDEVVVRLDPGRAFGSGSHASTRLALEALVAWLPPGGRVLDVGCGSGVLAVAAALLGAGAVRAVDIDPEAIAATAANAERNGVRVDASLGSAGDLADRFDLVVANISAGALIDDASAVLACVAPGGHLVLAGLLADRADDVAAAYTGATQVERRHEDGWLALVLRA
jgi:ribosomal protein L11 methyltransferase